jgi:hypothetical protein
MSDSELAIVFRVFWPELKSKLGEADIAGEQHLTPDPHLEARRNNFIHGLRTAFGGQYVREGKDGVMLIRVTEDYSRDGWGPIYNEAESLGLQLKFIPNLDYPHNSSV